MYTSWAGYRLSTKKETGPRSPINRTPGQRTRPGELFREDAEDLRESQGGMKACRQIKRNRQLPFEVISCCGRPSSKPLLTASSFGAKRSSEPLAACRADSQGLHYVTTVRVRDCSPVIMKTRNFFRRHASRPGETRVVVDRNRPEGRNGSRGRELFGGRCIGGLSAPGTKQLGHRPPSET